MNRVGYIFGISLFIVLLGGGRVKAAPPDGSNQYPILPDQYLTPGATFNVGVNQICQSGYSSSVRNVSTAVKNQVYSEYHVSSHYSGEYEVDHLISLELGGSNDIKNLWPQAFVSSPWNAHVKDKLENKLHSLICSGQISLSQAQYEISHNWTNAYLKYIGSP